MGVRSATMRAWWLPLLLAGLAMLAWSSVTAGSLASAAGDTHAASGATPRVLEAPLEGTIDPVAKEWVDSLIHQARSGGYEALVLTTNTPGGLSTSMTDIRDAILRAKDLPVIVYIAPEGA